MKIKNQRGFTAVEGLLIMVIIAVLGSTGWFVWHSRQNTDKLNDQSASDSNPPLTTSKTIKTYDDCMKSGGSKIPESYPPVCVTKDDKRFVQNTSHNLLIINEWSVKIPLSANTPDAFYTSQSEFNAPPIMHISTHNLQKLASQHTGCPNGINDIYLARSTTEDANSRSQDFAHIGSYYYHYGSVTEPLCATRIDPNDTIQKQIDVIQAELRNEVKSVSAE